MWSTKDEKRKSVVCRKNRNLGSAALKSILCSGGKKLWWPYLFSFSVNKAQRSHKTVLFVDTSLRCTIRHIYVLCWKCRTSINGVGFVAYSMEDLPKFKLCDTFKTRYLSEINITSSNWLFTTPPSTKQQLYDHNMVNRCVRRPVKLFLYRVMCRNCLFIVFQQRKTHKQIY